MNASSPYHAARLQRALEAAGVAAPAQLPWGAFTGVHPISYIRQNRNKPELALLGISPQKTALALEIIAVQESILQEQNPRLLYAGIPFCPSRCKYCSFVSESVVKSHKLIPQYTAALVREIAEILEQHRTFDSVYIGGGTPTALPFRELARVLELLAPLQSREFTLEAGRPETITEEVLQLAAQSTVTRISINPQSMNAATLEAIGRGHSVDDVYTAFERTRKHDFAVNMDLIGGLPGESLTEFENSLKAVIALAPENITVHSFAAKRAADWAQKTPRADYTQGAYGLLKSAGYFPYYLYRQSNCLGDNIGYAKTRATPQGRLARPEGLLDDYAKTLESICRYNVFMMDTGTDVQVHGAGCGAASRISGIKSYNPKYPHEYIATTPLQPRDCVV